MHNAERHELLITGELMKMPEIKCDWTMNLTIEVKINQASFFKSSNVSVIINHYEAMNIFQQGYLSMPIAIIGKQLDENCIEATKVLFITDPALNSHANTHASLTIH